MREKKNNRFVRTCAARNQPDGDVVAWWLLCVTSDLEVKGSIPGG